MAEVKCRVAGIDSGIDSGFSLEVHDAGDAFISTTLTQSGCWEPFETEIVRRLLGAAPSCSSPLFVDCGANLGWYSVVAGLLGADVVACEPMPANAALLRRNVSLNQLSTRVEIHETALGSTDGSAMLHLSPTNQGDHRLHAGASLDPSKERATVSVSVCTLNEILGGRRPAVIKLDTQGSEVAILTGGRSGWEPRLGLPDVALVTEFWPYGLERCGSSASEFLALVKPLIATSHRCYEIVEHSRSMLSRSLDELVMVANSVGLSNDVRGFVNLAFVPTPLIPAIEDLVEPVVFDVRGLGCGSVLVRLAALRRTLAVSTKVAVWTDDAGAPEELPAWCRMTGQTYVGPSGSEQHGAAEQYVLILSPTQPTIKDPS